MRATSSHTTWHTQRQSPPLLGTCGSAFARSDVRHGLRMGYPRRADGLRSLVASYVIPPRAAHTPPRGTRGGSLVAGGASSRCAFRAARPNARQRALYQSAFALYQIARGPQIAPRRPEGPVLKPSAPTFHPPWVPRAARSESTRCAIGEADPCFVGAGLVVGYGGHVPSIRICFDPSAGQGKGSRAGGPSDRNGGNRAGQSTRDLDHAVRRWW